MDIKEKRSVNGILLLDKPAGLSSNQALQKAKRLYQAKKAGHTGSLDPLATGLLPLCFGEATKFSQLLLEADKTYVADIKLGSTTSTGDAEGQITSTQSVAISLEQLNAVLEGFVGPIKQIPPMYSALKFEGKPLYQYARADVEIERPARDVTIHSISLQDFSKDILKISVSCSKGTYIRVLAEDIGKELGCGAFLAGLKRMATGGLTLAHAIDLEQLAQLDLSARDRLLMPVDALMSNCPKVYVDSQEAHYLRQGKQIYCVMPPGLPVNGRLVSIYEADTTFLGAGTFMEDGKLAPKRLVNL